MSAQVTTSGAGPDQPPAAGEHPFDDHTSPEVAAWMEPWDAQARRWLAEQPAEPFFRRRLAALLAQDTVQSVVLAGTSRFELRRPAGESQASIFRVEADGTSHRVVDAATLSADGTVAITSIQLNPGGTVLAWSTIDGGADWATIRFLALDGQEPPAEELTGLKAPELAWTGPDSFAYLHFPMPPPGQELLAPNGGTSIRQHRLGTAQSEDVVLLERESPTWMFPTATEEGCLLVEEAVGIVPARVHVLDLATGALRTVVDGQGPTTVLGLHEGEVVVATNVGAPDGAVEAVRVSDGRRRTVVPQSQQPLEAYETRLVGGQVFTVRHGLEASVLEAHDLRGTLSPTPVPLPPGAFVTSVEGPAAGDSRLVVHVQVPVGPQAVLVHDAATASTTELLRRGEVDLEVDSRLVWATSDDGTAVPMRVHRRADTPADGSAPVLLLTYGGYNRHFLANGYQPWQLAWVEAGGVLAHAGIRGGGELGSSWHEAATTPHKARGVDDLLACASWFAQEGWSAPGQVVTNGMSNGGLMVAAAMTRRPDLFAAVVPEVAVLDLLRFHLFTAGHGWVREFGDPDDPAQRPGLEACSPLHTLREGEDYPATLLLTADMDDRVPPGPHSYVFFDRLRRSQKAQAPILLRVSRGAGHFTGRSLAEQVDERTAVLTFAASALGLDPAPTHPAPSEEPA